ncbi:conserved hypothetical protein [Listeria monocytogenes FSL J2-071]|nr:conserved hypothetical protein [Listeria monocytogenes FSL J2-071]
MFGPFEAKRVTGQICMRAKRACNPPSKVRPPHKLFSSIKIHPPSTENPHPHSPFEANRVTAKYACEQSEHVILPEMCSLHTTASLPNKIHPPST